jgi:hypothetical protein
MKRMEHIDAARDEALKLGAVLTIEYGKKHIIGVLYFNGNCRKTSFSNSPSRLACYQTIKFIRRMIKEMQNV